MRKRIRPIVYHKSLKDLYLLAITSISLALVRGGTVDFHLASFVNHLDRIDKKSYT